jgi:uncharacterized protein (DUF1330 family)
MSPTSKYYQLVLIWVRVPETFREYLGLLPPVVARYGGAADRSVEPAELRGAGLARPDVVNLVHYDSEPSFRRFTTDPDFAAIEPLRSRSVDLLAFEGRLVHADPSSAGLAQRLYVVELVTYRDGSPDAYRRYQKELDVVMRRYGYRVEYVLQLDPRPGEARQPDLATVAYFPDTDLAAAFRVDPLHDRIENELYSAAVTDPIRITGRVHPATLDVSGLPPDSTGAPTHAPGVGGEAPQDG